MTDSDSNTAREEIIKDVATVIALKELIEKSFCKSEAEKEQERYFSKLQTDVQILLAICLGFLALAGSSLIAFAELKNVLFFYVTFFFGVIAIVLAVVLLYTRYKMEKISIKK